MSAGSIGEAIISARRMQKPCQQGLYDSASGMRPASGANLLSGSFDGMEGRDGKTATPPLKTDGTR